MNLENKPVVYQNQCWIYKRLLNDGRVLIQRRILVKGDDGHTTSTEDLFQKVDVKAIAINQSASYMNQSTMPLAIVTGYQISADLFGKRDRRKNLLNSILHIRKYSYIQDSGEYIITLSNELYNNLDFHEDDLALIGFEPICNPLNKYNIGDMLVSRKDDRESGIKKGQRVVIESINDVPENDFFGTLGVKKIETGENELPVIVFPKNFRREKKNII